MSAQSMLSPAAGLPARPPLPLWLRQNPLLAFAVLSSLALLIVAGAGLLLDPRLITGAPAWAKPFKFSVSIAVYCASLAWLLTFVRGHPRWTAFIGGVTALSLLGELAVITVQVVRGRASHFNVSTPLDETLWVMMGMLIIPVWLMGLAAAGLLVFQRLGDPAFAWSLRLGVMVAAVGMGLGFLMTEQTTPAQQAAWSAGLPEVSSGAHSVGVEDGGPGLPLVGWSTVAGDLRVAHFAGLHALQVLPLAGYAIARAGRGLGARRRLVLAWTAGLGYLGFVLLLAWQALRGQSIVAPDALTLAAFGALAAAAAGVSALVVLSAPRQAADLA